MIYGKKRLWAVIVDLTATGKLETTTCIDHLVTPDFTVVDNGNASLDQGAA